MFRFLFGIIIGVAIGALLSKQVKAWAVAAYDFIRAKFKKD